MNYKFIGKRGQFKLEDPDLINYLYFPIANDAGVLSCVTPNLSGDNKMGQNTFLLEPVSSEDLHNNKSSRNFWCNIKGRGLWSATGKSSWQQAQLFTDEKESASVEAGVMWHKLKRNSKKYGISSEIISFVPYTSEKLELMIITIKNTTEEALEVIPTAAIPMYGRSADNIRDHRHVTSLLHRIETTKEGILLNPTLTFDERGHNKNEVYYGVFGSDEIGQEPEGFYPCVEDFIGEGGSFENPKALLCDSDALVKEGCVINGYEALGGIQFSSVTLLPNEEKTFIITMGYGRNKEEIISDSRKFSTKEACMKALVETQQYWDDKINISYSSGTQEFDAWMHWVNFQPMLRRLYGCSFLPHHDYGKGGRGWRDLWQDCLALLIMNPTGVKDMLLDNFNGVRIDGSNATIIGTKQGEFIADRNNITRVWMDHGMWPFLTTYLYIMQTGDIDILLNNCHYFKDIQVARGEKKDMLWLTEQGYRLRTNNGDDYQGSILEHILVQHLTAFYDVGEHNHMRLRGADWNDALDMASNRGESVAFTAIYGGNLSKIAELLLELNQQGTTEVFIAEELLLLLEDKEELYNDVTSKQSVLYNYCEVCRHTISGLKAKISCIALAANLTNKANWIKNNIQKTEWITAKNGHSWYNGYYDNSGERVEGEVENEIRMMLTSQVFTIMSKTATEDQVKKIVAAADTYLYNKSVGGYRLNTDFKEIKTDLGRMFGFAYGHKENGAVFSHMAVMYSNALYQRGYAKEGFKVINSLFQHSMDFKKSRIYPGIPEYFSDRGRGMYHYLTGAASWLLLTVLTEMFGVKGHYGDLSFEPKLLREQFNEEGLASVELVFADKKLLIEYINRGLMEYGDYKIKSIHINDTDYDCETSTNRIRRCDIDKLDDGIRHIIRIQLS